ncbi:YbgC/FadM family acyl-CoA thioesterase [Desulfobacterales bacterium HSG16]|nr:YbgC/FadM family acyl-CoA thioesterase [Desulfobacterales bacterium HSG16]
MSEMTPSRTSGKIYHFPVQVYYEDTDHSGVVYHANYLKYFERAREDVIGIKELSRLWYEDGLGFAVYKADIAYHEGAIFGDVLDIRTSWEKESRFRIIWHQEAWRPNGEKSAVTAVIHLVCLDQNKKVKPIPDIEL